MNTPTKQPAPPDIEPQPKVAPTISAARSAAIGELLLRGYTDQDGRPHKVCSPAHAEFLARAGTVTLPK